MIILRFKIKLFFKLLKHKIPAYYFLLKHKLGLFSEGDELMLRDCLDKLYKDKKEMFEILGKMGR